MNLAFGDSGGEYFHNGEQQLMIMTVNLEERVVERKFSLLFLRIKLLLPRIVRP